MSFNIDPDDLNNFNDLKQKWVKDDSNKLKVMRIYPYDSNLFQFCKSAQNYFRLLKTNSQTFRDTKYFQMLKIFSN